MNKLNNFFRELWEVLKEAGYFIYLALRAFRFWHRDPPVSTVDELARFAETRSKFVSQITLYGYIKTRAGTRYTELFKDDVFALSLNIAKWEIYLACLGDLSIYTTAKIAAHAASTKEEACALAIHIFDAAIRDEEPPKDRPQGFGEATEAFHVRARLTDWANVLIGENSFEPSLAALVEWAPIADELKEFDVQIVRNSMRFKWKAVRDQLEPLLQIDPVIADWRAGSSAV